MKPLYLIFIVLYVMIVGCHSLHAQNIKEYYMHMPDTILPYLTNVNKADMPDFINSKMAAKVKNRFQEITEMTQLTDDFLEIKTSPSSSFQLKLLPKADSTYIIGLITSVKAPISDSQISFYTTEWKNLSMSSFLSLPDVEDFVLNAGELRKFSSLDSCDVFSNDENYSDTISEDLYAQVVRELNKAVMYSLSFDPKDLSIRVYLTTPGYLSRENRKVVESCMKKDPILLRWKDDKFYIEN